MAVYVDPLFSWPGAPKIRGQDVQWCHLTADRDKELHAFARKLKLREEWVQQDSYGLHYDLTDGKRVQAVIMGAIELTRDQAGLRLKAIREGRDKPIM